MSRICPHCAYARQIADTAPDWQCPACTRAYNKAGDDTPAGAARHAVAPARPGGGRWLLMLLACAAAIWFSRPLWQAPTTPSPTAATSGHPTVLLYATDWCGYCKASREFFEANGIRYTEHDIEKSSAALGEHQKLGGQGVPLIVIGDEVIKGYNETTMRELLRPWLKG